MTSFKSTFLVSLLVSCALFSVAHADVKYTTVVKHSFAKSPADHSTKANQNTDTDTYFVAPEKSRQELVWSSGIHTSREVLITRCDLKKQFRLDDALKIYNVWDWNPIGFNAPASESELKENIPERKTVTHYSIQKLTSEKVNGFDTECYQVTETNKFSGDLGDGEWIDKMKIWVANVQGWQSCDPEKVLLPASYISVVNLPEGRRTLIEEYTGDVDEMNKINQELPVRVESILYTGKNAPADSEVDQNLTSYLPNEKFDDSLFEIPSGYREVSFNEYENLHSDTTFKTVPKSKHSKPKQVKALFIPRLRPVADARGSVCLSIDNARGGV